MLRRTEKSTLKMLGQQKGSRVSHSQSMVQSLSYKVDDEMESRSLADLSRYGSLANDSNLAALSVIEEAHNHFVH